MRDTRDTRERERERERERARARGAARERGRERAAREGGRARARRARGREREREAPADGQTGSQRHAVVMVVEELHAVEWMAAARSMHTEQSEPGVKVG
jgi:hypothetical protein